ncbi:MAG: CAP domain-containing protein, partial [Ilumatobacteraceae bacterium]|nr:CAP domain-containing protein [Ilumatobacteraceae bacterium]
MFQQTNNPACGPRKLLTLVIAAMASFGLLAIPATSAGVVEAQGPADHDWVSIVNTYRAQSGLSPITENPSWSLGGQAHSCWMLLNGIAHDEAPGTAGYSVAGDEAGNSGNVAVSSDPTATARDQIDLWMSGPYHAIGILRSTLREAGYGGCSSPPNPSATPWKSGGTLDVIRGNDWGAPRPTVPVVFPGNGATTSLTRFVAETPDPRIDCGWNGQTVGLPLLALMPAGVSSATASLTGPTGPIPTCVLHASNTSGTASSILGGDNAVIVMPNAPLAA